VVRVNVAAVSTLLVNCRFGGWVVLVEVGACVRWCWTLGREIVEKVWCMDVRRAGEWANRRRKGNAALWNVAWRWKWGLGDVEGNLLCEIVVDEESVRVLVKINKTTKKKDKTDLHARNRHGLLHNV